MNEPLRAFLVRAFQGFYQPRSALNPWQWHELHRTELGTAESQDYAGPYDSALAPQNRFFMEFAAGRFSENIEFDQGTPADAVWRECIIMKSSQVGVTLSLLLVLVWWIAEVRKNVIYAIDTTSEAKRISKARLQPLVRSCPAAASRIQEDEDAMSNLTLYLLGLIVYIIGGAAEGAFQNKTASLGILDEADFHQQPPPGKPNNLDDLRSRMKAVSDAKIYSVSKPKTEEHVTFREWKTGTRHTCRVPCPHCGHYQELIWEGMRYEHLKDMAGDYDLERVKRETFYECESCHGRIEEKNKREMMLAHRWVQTNPHPTPSKISAHLSDLYSQFPTAAWGILACEYIEGLKSMSKMTAFRTDRLGKPSRLAPTGERKPEDILKLRRIAPTRYNRGTIPERPALMAMGADVQGDVKKWVRGGFLRSGELFIVDWGYTLTFDELIEVASDPIPIGLPFEWPKNKPWDGDTCRVDQGIIDEGHIHLEVRRFCLRSDGLFVPSKGRGGIQVRHTVAESPSECDGDELVTYHFDDDAFKKQLYVDRIANLPKIIAGKTRTPRMYMPWEVDAEFSDELCSERLGVESDRMGFHRERWKKDPSTPNDFGDALKQLLVIWYWLSPDILAQPAPAASSPKPDPLTSPP
ncbi:MAG: terminase gpA endonuclease subunit [Verrucomicrobiae bacterium]